MFSNNLTLTQQSFASHDETTHAETETKSPTQYFGANHTNVVNQSPHSTNQTHPTSNFFPFVKSRKHPPSVIVKNSSPETNTEASCVQNRAPATQCSSKERIYNPSKVDVLYGRGGAINNHQGNITFRSLVNARRENYKSDRNKTRKSNIAQDIINQIKRSGGRFLERECIYSPTSGQSMLSNYWIEASDVKTMSKTSQALREVVVYTNTQQMGAASARKKRPSESKQIHTHEISNRNIYESMKTKTPLLKKPRTNDIPSVCHDDQSSQERILSARLETKQEVTEYTQHPDMQGCDQIGDMKHGSRKKEGQIVTEAQPRPIQDESAHASTSNMHIPIFRIDEPIFYSSAMISKCDILHPPDRITRLNSLGFANEDLDEESFTDIFENEDLCMSDLETTQECHHHLVSSQDSYNDTS